MSDSEVESGSLALIALNASGSFPWRLFLLCCRRFASDATVGLHDECVDRKTRLCVQFDLTGMKEGDVATDQ